MLIEGLAMIFNLLGNAIICHKTFVTPESPVPVNAVFAMLCEYVLDTFCSRESRLLPRDVCDNWVGPSIKHHTIFNANAQKVYYRDKLRRRTTSVYIITDLKYYP